MNDYLITSFKARLKTQMSSLKSFIKNYSLVYTIPIVDYISDCQAISRE